MKKKHVAVLPEDVAAARKRIDSIRATLSHLLDDSDVVKGKTWKRLNKAYQALESAHRELDLAQDMLEEAMPKLLKQFDK